MKDRMMLAVRQFCSNFRWEVGNTTSGKCSETQSEVSDDGAVCNLYDTTYDEETIQSYVELNRIFGEVYIRAKSCNDGYTDVFGNYYKGLTLTECMDTLVDSVEKNGLWYELDVQSCNGFGYDFCFAPFVSFHMTDEEYRTFFARISDALKVFKKAHSFLFDYFSDETTSI